MKTLPISVLIPTMNRPDSLNRTIQSLFSQEFIPAQIIVVDQSITEEQQKRNHDIVEHFKSCADAKYFYQEKPSSTAARNNAFRFSTNEIIIFSDDDVDVEPNTLERVYQIMQDQSVAMIGGLNRLSKGRSTPIGFLTGTRSFKKRNQGHVTAAVLSRYPNEVHGQVRTEWAYGYFFAVRKSCMKRWSLCWDEKLTSYAYAEDLDFSYQYFKMASREGLKCILDEQVIVSHLASKEFRVSTAKEIYMYVINRAYICYKHNMGFVSECAMNWANFCQLVSSWLKRSESFHDYYGAMKKKGQIKEDLKNGIIPADAYEAIGEGKKSR